MGMGWWDSSDLRWKIIQKFMKLPQATCLAKKCQWEDHLHKCGILNCHVWVPEDTAGYPLVM